MKEIKAFIHRNRAADVVHALHHAEFRHISVSGLKGTLQALSMDEQRQPDWRSQRRVAWEPNRLKS